MQARLKKTPKPVVSLSVNTSIKRKSTAKSGQGQSSSYVSRNQVSFPRTNDDSLNELMTNNDPNAQTAKTDKSKNRHRATDPP